MKHILKQENLPDFLEDWKNRKQSQLAGKSGQYQMETIKSSRIFQQLRNFITEEQGYICAYCNRNIHPGNPLDDEQSRLDHIKPKSLYPEDTLNYHNLVASCHGNEREPHPREVHCDVQKQNTEIPYELFPTNPDCEYVFSVSYKGHLVAKDESIQKAINTTLNLNCNKLVQLRKNILVGFAENIPEPEDSISLINFYSERNAENRFQPFAGIIINFLRQYCSTTS